MRVFVTGATGFIGRKLVQKLRERGDEVIALTRDPSRASGLEGCQLVQGDPSRAGPWTEELARCDAVVHLAGEPLMARRWSPEQKQRILASRVEGTRRVASAIERAARPPVLVNASAIGIYGPREDELLDESAEAGADFLAQVCRAWEAEALRISEKTRVVVMRTGVVLGEGGGALERMLLPFRLFAGGPIGSGQQWMSWIHLEDLVGLFLLALDSPQARGPLNGTAPNPVRMSELAAALGKAMGRPSWLKVPGAALRLAVGEAATVVLTGQRVQPRKALELGYRFRFTQVEEALREILALR